MTKTKTTLWTTRVLIAVVAFALCGMPEIAEAQATQAPPPPDAAGQNPTSATPQAAGQNNPQPQSNQGIIDPSKGPLQPATPSQTLPEAPSAQQQPESNAPDTQPGPRTQQPAGAAVGQQGVTSGGAASRPAGTAIAPAKQRQYRSLLLKIGAVAAAGAAIGTVLALSKGSPSNPPGAK